MSSAASLKSGACGLTDGSTAGQWRLPTKNELVSRQRNQQGFNSVQPKDYWTSSSDAGDTTGAWVVNMGYGNVFYGIKSNSTSYYYVWPVRGYSRLGNEKETIMKHSLVALAVAVFCGLTVNLSTAEAVSYAFTIVNNLNAYIPSKELNANAVCWVNVKFTTGGGVVTSNTIQLRKAVESATITPPTAFCNLQKVSATCTFKDYAGKEKTETKESDFENCGGGTYYILPEPLNPQWTSFSIKRY